MGMAIIGEINPALMNPVGGVVFSVLDCSVEVVKAMDVVFSVLDCTVEVISVVVGTSVVVVVSMGGL